jgi:hypothetical protein
LVSLSILPKEATLRGLRAQQRLVVSGTYSDGSVRDLSAQASYLSLQPKVAAVAADGLVKPAGDGSAEIKAFLGKVGAKASVKVTESHAPAPLSFSRDIVPIFTQAGCNVLTCHGSPVGRGGFKLSMYGYEPAADYAAIVKQERAAPEKGKRVDLAAAEKSLILLKPSMQAPHQGGMRFPAGSPQYAALLSWLQAGAPADVPDPQPAVTRLEVLPSERVFSSAGERQRLAVTAYYSDGTSEDVTHKAVFGSNDEVVAKVEDGSVQATGVGETAVFARYLGRVGVAEMLVPQAEKPSAREYAVFKPANMVDQLALAKWKKMGFVPAELATDAEFLRRVSLDLTGTLPAPEEIRAFLADGSPDKRARKIEELLAKPEYADWWTVFWGDNLRNNGRVLQPNGAKAFHDWIRASVADNKPYDQFVRELVTATGRSFTSGPVNFYRVAKDPPERAEQVAQLFLGVRLQCAQCHNHPFEKWTRTSYHQFAAFFARVASKGVGNNENEYTLQPKGEYKNPETAQTLAPAVLGDELVTIADDKDRREALADWLVSGNNVLFARNLVNRMWAQLFGKGIVEPVDDFRSTNPPTNEALLDWLAKDFVAHKYDVKYLLRTLAGSRTYQLSVRATRRNEKDRQYFSRAYYRRLKAEALLDGVCSATKQPESYKDYPAGTRAIQLTDNRTNSYFLDTFGRPRREVVCTCEREETTNLTQALHLINGETLNRKISSDKGRTAELVNGGKGNPEIVEELYLCTLSRLPTPEESGAALKLIEGAGASKRLAVDDLLWVLLNSRAFLFNH